MTETRKPAGGAVEGQGGCLHDDARDRSECCDDLRLHPDMDYCAECWDLTVFEKRCESCGEPVPYLHPVGIFQDFFPKGK